MSCICPRYGNQPHIPNAAARGSPSHNNVATSAAAQPWLRLPRMTFWALEPRPWRMIHVSLCVSRGGMISGFGFVEDFGALEVWYVAIPRPSSFLRLVSFGRKLLLISTIDVWICRCQGTNYDFSTIFALEGSFVQDSLGSHRSRRGNMR